MNLVAKAEFVATEESKTSFRRDGVTPQIEHPRAVVAILRDEGATDEELATAWLHDLIEDEGVTVEELQDLGFPTSVVNAVSLLTHKENEPYLDYIRRLVGNEIARKVKIADIRANIGDHPSTHALEKYKKALPILRAQ